MRVLFRQGIVRQRQSASQPNFLALVGTNVNLVASTTEPTIITFAHGNADYLFQEIANYPAAWVGPFGLNESWWLYWDIDLKTGKRTFGRTRFEPIDSPTPPTPNVQSDQHWFDMTQRLMKVRVGNSWVVRLRVFAGEVNGGTLIQNTLGTQVGINVPTGVRAGYLLFDDTDNPIKKFQQFNLGEFITTESPLASQFSKIQNFRLEAAFDTARAIENIPQWRAVCYKGPGELGLAQNIEPNFPAIGVAAESMITGEDRAFIVTGYISDPTWNYGPPGAPIFVDTTGGLTTIAPIMGSLQRMGYVVDRFTLHIQIEPLIRYGV